MKNILEGGSLKTMKNSIRMTTTLAPLCLLLAACDQIQHADAPAPTPAPVAMETPKKVASLNVGNSPLARTRPESNAAPDTADASPAAQDTPAGEEKVRTLADWQGYITKDAKVSAITAILGKPDAKRSAEGSGPLAYSCLVYTWYRVLDEGTTRASGLSLYVAQVQGENVVVAIEEPTTDTIIKFPWCDAALGIPQNPLDAKDAQGNPLFHLSPQGTWVNSRNQMVNENGQLILDDYGHPMTIDTN